MRVSLFVGRTNIAATSFAVASFATWMALPLNWLSESRPTSPLDRMFSQNSHAEGAISFTAIGHP